MTRPTFAEKRSRALARGRAERAELARLAASEAGLRAAAEQLAVRWLDEADGCATWEMWDGDLRNCSEELRAALAAPPSATLAGLRELWSLLSEVVEAGVEFEDERVRYVSVQLDRADFRERIQAALAATGWLAGEGAGDG